jgi:hypothetical protein
MKQITTLLIFALFSYGSIGQVVTYKGSAYIKRGFKKITIRTGTKLQKKDTVITRNNSKLQIEFKDRTIITVGKNSKLKIDNYLFDDNKQEEASTSISFLKGIFKTITGKIGKLNPEKFRLKTKTASIGIRGTSLIINAKKRSTFVACTDGSIIVTSLKDTKQSVDVDSGEFTIVKSDTPPTQAQELNEENLNKLFNQYSNKFSKKFAKLKEKFPKRFADIKTFKDLKKAVGAELSQFESFDDLKNAFPDDLKNIDSFDEMASVFGNYAQDIGHIDLEHININLLDDYLERLEELKKEYNIIIQE